MTTLDMLESTMENVSHEYMQNKLDNISHVSNLFNKFYSASSLQEDHHHCSSPSPLFDLEIWSHFTSLTLYHKHQCDCYLPVLCKAHAVRFML